MLPFEVSYVQDAEGLAYMALDSARQRQVAGSAWLAQREECLRAAGLQSTSSPCLEIFRFGCQSPRAFDGWLFRPPSEECLSSSERQRLLTTPNLHCWRPTSF